MVTVNVQEAKTHLSRLLARVEAGEEIVITRNGDPVARLVSARKRGRPEPDVLRGRVVVPDSFFDPLPSEDLAVWQGD